MNRLAEKSGFADERGTALVTSIFAILIGTLIGVALSYEAITTLTISTNDRDTTEAFYLADSGIVHASALINRAKKGSYSTILATGDTTADTGDELSAPPETGLWTAAESIPAGNNLAGGFVFGTGRYFVSIRNDTAAGETATTDKNGILIVTSTGIGRDGATATLETVVKTVALNVPGLLVDGDAVFTNRVRVIGSNATIQVNGDLTLLGTGMDSCAENNLKIMGPSVPYPNLDVGPLCNTAPVEGTTLLFGQPRNAPPIFDIPTLQSKFKPLASWVFKDNGEIYPVTNGVERVLSLSALELSALGLDGWTFNLAHQRWTHSANQLLPDGNYYFQNTNARLTKGGDIVNPPRVSLFVEGHVVLNNEIALQPFEPGYALVTANDLHMSSKYSTTTNPGLVYAYGQIKFSNATNIHGSMIAADFYKADGTKGPDVNDPGGSNLVDRIGGVIDASGTVNIIASDYGNLRGSSVVSWREVRY